MAVANNSIERDKPQASKRIDGLLIGFLLISLLAGCSSKKPPSKSIPMVALSKYKTFISYEDGALGNPILLRQGPDSHLFVYDAAKKRIVEMNNGQAVNSFGGAGRGPGEFIRVNNIFWARGQLYAVDPVLQRISRFDLDGELAGTMNFGQKGSHAMPPPAPRAKTPRAVDIDNQPAVMPNSKVLLPAITPKGTTNALYKLADWYGNPIADLGAIPKGSAFTLNYDRYQSAVAEGTLPAYYKANAFAVGDRAHANELFLIYSDLSQITKYDTSGTRLWERPIPQTPERDSLEHYFYTQSKAMSGRSRIALDTYVAGQTTAEGDLFLALGKYHGSSNAVWIHRFDADGKLNKRYKLVSDEAKLVPIFAVDAHMGHIYIVTENAGIRSYAM